MTFARLFLSVFPFFKRAKSRSEKSERVSDYLPKSASQIKIVHAPPELIEAGEGAMQEMAKKQKN